MYTHSQTSCHKIIILNNPLHNVELMLCSSAFFIAWLIIGFILLHLELSMQERLRVSFLVWGTLVATSIREHGYTKILDGGVFQGTHPAILKDWEQLRGGGNLPKTPLKVPTAQCFPSWSGSLQPGFPSGHDSFLTFSFQQCQYQ